MHKIILDLATSIQQHISSRSLSLSDVRVRLCVDSISAHTVTTELQKHSVGLTVEDYMHFSN